MDRHKMSVGANTWAQPRQMQPPRPQYNDEKEKKNFRKNCVTGVIAMAMIATVIAVVSLILAIGAQGAASNLTDARSYMSSGVIRDAPFTAHLDSSAAPLGMTLPNDLSNYIGKQYAIYSTTAQPHTVTIDAGTLTTTWDGTNTVATFGGAIGDGLTFRVIAKNRIAILPPTNVAFS